MKSIKAINPTKERAADLKAIYGAPTIAEAEAALNQFVILFGERVPA